ncbi:amino acid ABC transporter substrate-binding protein [Duganella callida]|uniref:amino acid ABC transporter substrate-binding protein n=1 Tax=Duganella callida TaxID=2561932 RepID=UPI0014314562|nr:amino acid ABC transporter substrate-binding protein [Duganella callida]
MKYWSGPLLFICAAAAHAATSCTPVRIGYSDRERVPYYMGNGGEAPEKPGVLVELFRDAFRSVGCQVVLVRLPVARVRLALSSGAVDVAPADTPADERAGYVIATLAGGQADLRRALKTTSYVFVRSDDKLPPETDPAEYFRTHTLAANQGTLLASQLKSMGLQVDDGSFSSWNNLDKVRLKRADGFTLALLTPSALDPYVTERYGKLLTRMEKPVRTSYMWLGANSDYYRRNRVQVEAVWNWLGTHGMQEVDALTRRYAPGP